MLRNGGDGIGSQAGRCRWLRVARCEPHDRLHCLERADAPRAPWAMEGVVPVGDFRARPQEFLSHVAQFFLTNARGVKRERRQQPRARIGMPRTRRARQSNTPDALPLKFALDCGECAFRATDHRRGSTGGRSVGNKCRNNSHGV